MNLTGEYLIAADREAVWRAINDPAVLRQCIPGCEDITRETPTDWVAIVVTRVGPVKARFTGRIRLEDLDPPTSCRIVGEGAGGPAGFVKGAALVRLIDEEGATRLTYHAESEIGGKLAQIGARLIDSFAKKYADEFFGKFSTLVAGAPAVAAATRTAAVQPTVPGPASAEPATRPVQHNPGSVEPYRGGRFDPQVFTVLVLAALLVFMTIMYALKP